MADIDEKTPLNVPGKFYVDSSCIDCDLCRETAPENFGRDDVLHQYPEVLNIWQTLTICYLLQTHFLTQIYQLL